MKLFEQLDHATFEMYAIRHYYNPTCIDPDEFYEDLKRFKYLKRLINRYQQNGKMSTNLILNHLVVIFNVFGIESGLKMLEFKFENESDWCVMKPFLLYLKIIDIHDYVDIPMDKIAINELRNL